jgi:hypothetical protein
VWERNIFDMVTVCAKAMKHGGICDCGTSKGSVWLEHRRGKRGRRRSAQCLLQLSNMGGDEVRKRVGVMGVEQRGNRISTDYSDCWVKNRLWLGMLFCACHHNNIPQTR